MLVDYMYLWFKNVKALLQSTVFSIFVCFISLCFSTHYAKTRHLTELLFTLKCSLWYLISTSGTNFCVFFTSSVYHATEVQKGCPEALQHGKN